jgi:apolipoprotein N-acyltransferase
LGRRTIDIADERVGALICYEQLIPWPMVTSVSERPTVWVAISNAVWTRNTPIPAVQAGSVRSWSRLFGIPALTAVNW